MLIPWTEQDVKELEEESLATIGTDTPDSENKDGFIPYIDPLMKPDNWYLEYIILEYRYNHPDATQEEINEFSRFAYQCFAED
jgi:hypothetical protein